MADEGRHDYLVIVRKEPMSDWSTAKKRVASDIRTLHPDATITGVEDENNHFQVTVSSPQDVFIPEIQKLSRVASVNNTNGKPY